MTLGFGDKEPRRELHWGDSEMTIECTRPAAPSRIFELELDCYMPALQAIIRIMS